MRIVIYLYQSLTHLGLYFTPFLLYSLPKFQSSLRRDQTYYHNALRYVYISYRVRQNTIWVKTARNSRHIKIRAVNPRRERHWALRGETCRWSWGQSEGRKQWSKTGYRITIGNLATLSASVCDEPKGKIKMKRYWRSHDMQATSNSNGFP